MRIIGKMRMDGKKRFLAGCFLVLLCMLGGCGKTEPLQETAVRTENPSQEGTKETAAGETGETLTEKLEVLEKESARTPDERYESKAAEEPVLEFPDMTEKEDWYGDYQFIECVRPNPLYRMYESYILDEEEINEQMRLRLSEIMTLSETKLTNYRPKNPLLPVPELEDSDEYRYQIIEEAIAFQCRTMDGAFLEECLSRWGVNGREYHLDGGRIDYSEYAQGEDQYFSDMDFRISEWLDAPVLKFYRVNGGGYRDWECWIYGGDGEVYLVDWDMVSKWKKLR